MAITFLNAFEGTTTSIELMTIQDYQNWLSQHASQFQKAYLITLQFQAKEGHGIVLSDQNGEIDFYLYIVESMGWPLARLSKLLQPNVKEKCYALSVQYSEGIILSEEYYIGLSLGAYQFLVYKNKNGKMKRASIQVLLPKIYQNVEIYVQAHTHAGSPH